MASSFHTSWSTILGEKELKRDKKRIDNEFADAWDLVNEEKWKLNLKVANERKAMTKRVDSQIQFQNEAFRKKKQRNEVDDVYGSLNTFETTLASLELNDSVRLTTSSIVTNEISNGKNKSKQNNRRQKYIRDHESSQSTYFNCMLDTKISQQVLDVTEFEKSEYNQINVILQSTTTFIENRQKRNRLLEELMTESNEKNNKLFQEMVKRHNENLSNIEKKLYHQRIEAIESYDKKVSQSLATAVINDVINDAIDASEWVSSWRKFGIYYESMTSDSTYNDKFYESTSRLLKDANVIINNQSISFSKLSPLLLQKELIDSEFIQSLAYNDVNIYLDSITTTYLSDSMNADDTQCIGEPLSNPNWLFKTSRANMMGEVILRIEECNNRNNAITTTTTISDVNTSEVIPTIPPYIQPFKLFPFRVIITGVNNLLRKKSAYLLQSKVSTDLRVIRIDSLLKTAIEFGKQYYLSLLDQQSSLSPPSSSSSSLELLVELEDKHDKFHTLAMKSFELIQQGLTITDDICCDLIMNEINQLPDDSLGYILYDYPNTRKQANELIYALSGVIDYNQRIPQLNDIGSKFSIPAYRHDEFHDSTKCGLNLAIVIESPDISTTIDLQLQQLIHDETNELSCLNTHHQLFNNPEITLFPTITHNQAMAMDILTKEKEVKNMKSFFKKLHILKASTNFLPSDTEALNTFVDIILEEYDDSYAPENTHNNENEIANTTNVIHADKLSMEETGDNQQIEVIQEMQIPYAPLPTKLAIVLSGMWKFADKRSTDSMSLLFKTIRQTQYQFILRRRFVYDTLLTILNQPDIREMTLKDYMNIFNCVDIDFRFEDTFKAEMLLKSIELFQFMNEISLSRKTDAMKFIHTISNDGIVSVLIHSIYTSAVAFIQAHYSRYVTNLNILFDYTKAVFIPSTMSTQPSLLEETFDCEIDNATTKKTTNKSKVSKAESKSAINFTPYRNPIPSDQYIPVDDMKLIPDCNIDINVNIVTDTLSSGSNNNTNSSNNSTADKTAKSKKAKQPSTAVIRTGTTDSNMTSANQNLTRAKNTLLQLEVQIEENLKSFWSQDTFTLNRTLYSGSDEMIKSVEKTVWFESKRLLQEIKNIRHKVDDEVNWFIMMESSFSQYLTDHIVETFYSMETAENRSFYDSIEKAIDNNTMLILE